MARSLSVVGIAGSLRRQSYNRALLRAARDVAPEGMQIDIFDLSDLPLYNWDVEMSAFPEPARNLQERIRAADGLLVAIPEYLHSMPGVFKNAIDWASRGGDRSPLRGKPVAMMGVANGAAGTRWSQTHFRQVCHNTDMLPLAKPELYISDAQEKFDTKGNLVDEAVKTSLQALLSAFAAWIDGGR